MITTLHKRFRFLTLLLPLQYGIPRPYCLLKSNPCSTRNLTDWGSMMYSSEHSRVRLYTWTRYVSAVWKVQYKHRTYVICHPHQIAIIINCVHQFCISEGGTMVKNLVVQFLITCNSQGKNRAGASCMAYCFIPVLYGSETEQQVS